MVGRYRHFVRVERDAGPDGDNLPTFETQVESMPCFIQHVGGYESYRGRQLESGITSIVEAADCPEFGPIKGSARFVVLEGPRQLAPGTVLNVRYENVNKTAGRDSNKSFFCTEQVR